MDAKQIWVPGLTPSQLAAVQAHTGRPEDLWVPGLTPSQMVAAQAALRAAAK